MQLPLIIKDWHSPNVNPEKLLVEQLNLSIYHYLLRHSNKELAEGVVQTAYLKMIKTHSASQLLG